MPLMKGKQQRCFANSSHSGQENRAGLACRNHSLRESLKLSGPADKYVAECRGILYARENLKQRIIINGPLMGTPNI
jgi:hypothetical protein